MIDEEGGSKCKIDDIHVFDKSNKDITTCLKGLDSISCFRYGIVYISKNNSDAYLPCRSFGTLDSLADYASSLRRSIIEEYYIPGDSVHVVSMIVSSKSNIPSPSRIAVNVSGKVIKGKVVVKPVETELKGIVPSGDGTNYFLKQIQ